MTCNIAHSRHLGRKHALQCKSEPNGVVPTESSTTTTNKESSKSLSNKLYNNGNNNENIYHYSQMKEHPFKELNLKELSKLFWQNRSVSLTSTGYNPNEFEPLNVKNHKKISCNEYSYSGSGSSVDIDITNEKSPTIMKNNFFKSPAENLHLMDTFQSFAQTH